MELSVNPLPLPTSCVLLIMILIIILTATNKLILIIVWWLRPSFPLLYQQNPPPNESITVIVRKKKKSSANFVSLRCNRHHFNISSLSFLPCHLFHFFNSMDFCNHCRSLSFFNKTRQCCFSVLLIQSIFPFTWSVAMPLHCYYLVFSTFVTFFSLPPSCPQSPPSQDKIAFPRSAVHFFVLSLFFGPAQNPSLSCQQKHSQHRHQLKCK